MWDAVAVDAAVGRLFALRITTGIPLVPMRAQQPGSYVSVKLKL